MKRKRGHKKGKQKKHSVSAVGRNEPIANSVSLNTQDNSGFDDNDNTQLDFRMEVEASASTRHDYPVKPLNTDADGLGDRPSGRSGHGRVRVKLRSSKILESQRTSPDARTQSDTDKSSLQVGFEKQGEITEKMEDISNSLPEMPISVSGRSSRKAKSIKIKTSRGLGSSSATINPASSPIEVRGERTSQIASDNDKTVDSSTSRESHQREPTLPYQDSRYNYQELSAALVVIKKVMKMDAAEPFNIPVNPVALGIPDYFDVIETPMDFGTICSDLEHGNKYMNSEDVFKDVQYIWENCYRYNNKGDYILDLMKRVKKNFTKYWMAAGLYVDHPKRINDAALDQDSGAEGLPLEDDRGRDKALEAGRRKKNMISLQENVGMTSLNGSVSVQVENVAFSSQEKMHVKGSHLKHKTRRRHGINHHKSDCLCAVCVVRRRRQEREENSQMVPNKIGINDGNLSRAFKQEEISLLDNPCSEDASSNLDNSVDPDADADVEDAEEVKLETPELQYSPQQKQEMSENGMEIQKNGDGDASEKLLYGNGSGEESNPQSRAQMMEDPSFVIQPDTQKDDRSLLRMEKGTAAQHHDLDMQQKEEGSQGWHRRRKTYENLLHYENPLSLEICGTLFPDDPKSVWSGPHSLVCHHESVRRSAIGEAVAMFMK